jgi:hypothetical protein
VDPSSLIFLAIIAMWAAYLLGHWVRRRDQLATARSIDRFSESMRVLERRTPTRPVSAARPTARAYVVAPVRRPLPATVRRPATTPPASAARPTAAAHRSRIGREAARRRARLVLGLLVAAALAWLLAASPVLSWWPAAAVTALLAAVLVQMRRTARPAPRRVSGRSTVRPRGRRSRSLASRVPAPARRPRHHQDVRAVVEQVTASRRQKAGAVATTPASPADDGRPATQTASDQPTAAADRPASVGAPDEVVGGWQPVPVPPPTYTLKPKARPPVRRPVPTTKVLDDVPPARPSAPQPAPPAFDLDEILERRIAAGG